MNNIYIMRAKVIILLVLFAFANINMFGQITTTIDMMTQTGNTTSMTYTGSYILTLNDGKTSGNKSYTFTNSYGGIRIKPFTFDAAKRLNTTGTINYEYLEIITTGANGGIREYYGNKENYDWDYCGSYTNSDGVSYYYVAIGIQIPEIVVMPGSDGIASVTFNYYSPYGGLSVCTYPKFTATVEPTWCPATATPVDGTFFHSGNSVAFQWSPIADQASYKLKLTKPDGTTEEITTSSTSYTINNLDNGVYSWNVTAVGLPEPCEDYRTFSVCDGITALTCVERESLTPRWNSVETLSNRLLSWAPVSCADKYIVYVAPIAVGIANVLTSQYSLIFETKNTNYQLPILPEGEYYWVVQPVNTRGTDDENDDIKAAGCTPYRFKIKHETSSNHVTQPSTQGREFLFSLMQNGYYTYGNPPINKYTAIIASKEKGTVTFYYYNNGTRVDYEVEAGQTYSIDLPEDLVYHDMPGGQRGRTVRVTSTADISLYIANEATSSFDASIVLPMHALGNEYMIQTFVNNTRSTSMVRNPCFMIIADKDNTVINISGTNSTKINPSATTITLNEGESYFVKSNKQSNNDLSGIVIEVVPRDGHPEDSCKTIAVFNGNTVTGVPTSIDDPQDHLVEQAYPISNWGTKFAITSTTGLKPEIPDASYEDDVDYIRITAAKAGTVVTKKETAANGTITTTTLATLAAGATCQFALHRSKGSCYIETNNPVACYLYQKSSRQLEIDGDKSNDNLGDPSMVWISPIERGLEEITFSTFAATLIEYNSHYVNIVIPAEAWSATDANKFVYLDNINISGSFLPLSGNPNYMYARERIDHGTHTLVSEAKGKMVVHIYGLGDYRGYAYTAGSAAVPFRSTFSVAAGNGVALDVETLPLDYHFCGSTKYRFSVNSNASDIDSIIFDYGDGTNDTLVVTETVRSVEKTFAPGEYNMKALVYYRIYDYDYCQSSVVVDTVKDKLFVFVETYEIIKDTVCRGASYTFERPYLRVDNNTGNLVPDTMRYYNPSVTEPISITVTGYSDYGCKLEMTFELSLYPDMEPGSFIPENVECEGDNQSGVTLSVTKLINHHSAVGGDASAHYQWQRSETGVDGTWTNIEGQTNDSYTVTTSGFYRRAYISNCSIVYAGPIEITSVGSYSFNPGTHIDDTVQICHGSLLSQIVLGGDMANSSILYDENNSEYYALISEDGNNTTRVSVPMIWQDSVYGRGWEDIPNATGYNYTIGGNFTQSTYYRRIITSVGSCKINLDMGIFGVIVKPDFSYGVEKYSGCYGSNNAAINFAITGGSGSFTVTYVENNVEDGQESSVGTAVFEDGKYKCVGLKQNTSYIFTIVDNVYECTKTETITTSVTSEIVIGTVGQSNHCQGSSIDIPIPTISGGVGPYNVVVSSSGLGNLVHTINNTVNGDGVFTYTMPLDLEVGIKSVTYRVTDANGCSKESTQSVVIVNAIPEFTLMPTNLTSCTSPDGKIAVTIVNHTEGVTYDYYIDDAIDGDNKPSTYEFTGLERGTYTVKVESSNGCAAEKVSPSIEDNTNLVITAVATGDVHPLGSNSYYTCPDADVTISVTTINGVPIEGIASYYSYSFLGSGYTEDYSKLISVPDNCDNDVVVPISVKEESSGCIDNAEIVISVVDDQVPTVLESCISKFDVHTYFCDKFAIPNLTELVRPHITDNCVSDQANFAITQSITEGSEFFVSGGAKDVNVSVADLCSRTVTKKITVTPIPWPKFKIVGDRDPNCYCHGDNIVLTAMLENGAHIGGNYEGAIYKWYKLNADGEETEIADVRYSGVTTSELRINSATIDYAGTYRLTITDPKGCKYSVDITICVYPAIEFRLE